MNTANKVKTPRIAIIGAGMSGMLMAIKLKNAGLTDFVLFEKASEIGGTWRENRYPGVACDVASFAYCYEFEPNPNWSRRFSPGPEIQRYFKGVADKYQIRPFIRFNTEVVRAEYKNGVWHLLTAEGDRSEWDVLISASGPLHKRKYPDIAGLSNFTGKMFHTADWDDNYDITGKRIAIIGTGSSSVQMIDPVSQKAAHLTIFQRTAQWVIGTPNPYYSPLAIQLKNRIPVLGWMTRKFYDWVGEQFGRAALKSGLRRRLVNWMCQQNLNSVKDPALRQKLTPSDAPMCKRMIMSDTFYPAVQRSNVSVVTDAIDHIDAKGIVTKDGTLHELDLLVLATGFFPNAWGIPEVIGENGITLDETWKAGTRTYKSIAVPGFPNMFFLIGPNSPITNLSLIDIADIGVDFILQFIAKYRRGEVQTISPKPEVVARFTQDMIDAFDDTVWVTGCNSWYLDEKGVPATWPWAPAHYRKQLKTLNLDDFDVKSSVHVTQ